MPTGFAWTRLLILLPFLVADPAQAELPGGAAFLERMGSWSPESTSPAAKPGAPHEAIVPPRTPRLSSRYGSRRDPLDGSRRFHAGIDIPGAAGSPVFASAAGIVTFAGNAGGYGRMVEIDHGNGMRTRYAHLARFLVWPGTQVAQGAIVGRMGSTGRSTGTHLHFEIHRNGGPIDPLAVLSSAPKSHPVHNWKSSEPHLSDFAKARAKVVRAENGD